MKRLLLSLALLLTIGAGCASAQISRVNFATANCSAVAATCSVTYSPTAGHLVIVKAIDNGTATTLSASDNATGGSSTYTNAIALSSCTTPSGGYGCLEAYTCNVKSGATVITFNMSPSDAAAVIVIEYAGNATASCADGASTGATGTGTAQTANGITTTNAADLISSFMLLDSSAPGAFAGSGSYTAVTSLTCTTCGATIGAVQWIVAATATYTATSTTVSSVPWRAHTTAYKAAAGGGGCTAPPNQLMMVGVGNCKGH